MKKLRKKLEVKQKTRKKFDIAIQVIKDNPDIFADYLDETVNSVIKTFSFSNYRPVSILPILSEIFERIPFEQVSIFFGDFLLQQRYEFRKGYRKIRELCI